MTETFGKGTRVRIIKGDNAKTLGEIFWWGRSKWGHGMRAGITPDSDPNEKLWVDAAELVAIDEDGNELDPQPAYISASSAPEIAIRGIEVPYLLGRAITAVRVKRGYPFGKSSHAIMRLTRLRFAEEQLGCTIPDAIIAYVVSGLGSTREVSDIVRMTSDLYARFEARGKKPPTSIAFENDNGDYLIFSRDAENSDTTFAKLLHDEAFEEAVSGDLVKKLMNELGNPDEIERRIQPFEVVVDYLSEDEPDPDVPIVQWVKHKTFGRGAVESSERTSKGAKLTIKFENGETRKLLDSFVEFE